MMHKLEDLVVLLSSTLKEMMMQPKQRKDAMERKLMEGKSESTFQSHREHTLLRLAYTWGNLLRTKLAGREMEVREEKQEEEEDLQEADTSLEEEVTILFPTEDDLLERNIVQLPMIIMEEEAEEMMGMEDLLLLEEILTPMILTDIHLEQHLLLLPLIMRTDIETMLLEGGHPLLTMADLFLPREEDLLVEEEVDTGNDLDPTLLVDMLTIDVVQMKQHHIFLTENRVS